MQAEVPFKHVKPGETSQLLLSQQMSLPISGQCSHLRSTGFFVASRCYYLLSSLQMLLGFCSLPVAAFVACQVALDSPDMECDLGKLLPTQGTSSWCAFPHPGVCRWLFMDHILWSTLAVWGEVCGGERWKLILRSSPVMS